MTGQKSIARLQTSSLQDYLKPRALAVPFAVKDIDKPDYKIFTQRLAKQKVRRVLK